MDTNVIESSVTPQSLWAATAEPAPDAHPLEHDVTTDVAIVGAGYAGLSTALHLAEAGFRVMVLEANDIGWGASGRSGGQVIPGIKFDPDQMRHIFGNEAGQRAAELFGSTAGMVFRLIKRYQIRCEATEAGWIQPAHSEAALATALDRCRQWKEMGADVETLSKTETDDLLGTDTYKGGWIDRRGGSIQPLSYTRGLAGACMRVGVGVSVFTRVEKIQARARGWCLSTSGGPSVFADRVVICTNGYSTDLWPNLHKSIIAANSFQVATTPLSGESGSGILKGGVVASDTRKLLTYWRRDSEGRLVLGGRGTFADPKSAADFVHLEKKLRRMYPALLDQGIEFRWGGRVAITQDFLPHLHEPDKGIMVLVGCQGRGIALQTAMGQWIAEYFSSGNQGCLPVPITRLRPIPAYLLKRLYVSAMITYYKFRDALPV